MSARQTEYGRSPDAVCGTDDIGVDSDANGSADFVCGHSWPADSGDRDPRQREPPQRRPRNASSRLTHRVDQGSVLAIPSARKCRPCE